MNNEISQSCRNITILRTRWHLACTYEKTKIKLSHCWWHYSFSSKSNVKQCHDYICFIDKLYTEWSLMESLGCFSNCYISSVSIYNHALYIHATCILLVGYNYSTIAWEFIISLESTPNKSTTNLWHGLTATRAIYFVVRGAPVCSLAPYSLLMRSAVQCQWPLSLDMLCSLITVHPYSCLLSFAVTSSLSLSLFVSYVFSSLSRCFLCPYLPHSPHTCKLFYHHPNR